MAKQIFYRCAIDGKATFLHSSGEGKKVLVQQQHLDADNERLDCFPPVALALPSLFGQTVARPVL